MQFRPGRWSWKSPTVLHKNDSRTTVANPSGEAQSRVCIQHATDGSEAVSPLCSSHWAICQGIADRCSPSLETRLYDDTGWSGKVQSLKDNGLTFFSHGKIDARNKLPDCILFFSVSSIDSLLFRKRFWGTVQNWYQGPRTECAQSERGEILRFIRTGNLTRLSILAEAASTVIRPDLIESKLTWSIPRSFWCNNLDCQASHCGFL